MSANIALLDRGLALYGPEMKETRAMLRAAGVRSLGQLWSEGGARALPTGNLCPTDWITSWSSFSLKVRARFSSPAGMARSNAAYPIECLGRHSFKSLYSSIDKMKE